LESDLLEYCCIYVKEVYLNLGKEISASSVAAVYKDRMLVGAVFDPKFLDCKW